MITKAHLGLKSHNNIPLVSLYVNTSFPLSNQPPTKLKFLLPEMKKIYCVNPCPAEPGYTLLKKPTDLDLHCLPSSMQIYKNNLDQVT